MVDGVGDKVAVGRGVRVYVGVAVIVGVAVDGNSVRVIRGAIHNTRSPSGDPRDNTVKTKLTLR